MPSLKAVNRWLRKAPSRLRIAAAFAGLWLATAGNLSGAGNTAVFVYKNGMQVAINPATASVNPGGSVAFSGVITHYSVKTVYWVVDGVTNGNAAAGTIQGSGNTVTYVAPAAAGTHIVECVSTSARLVRVAATVTVGTAPSVSSVAVTPAAVTLLAGAQQAFSATVTGAGSFAPGVTWSAQHGTITSAGLYTAPAAGGSDVVTAASIAAPARTANSMVTVVVQPPAAPVLAGPVEMQANTGPYTASVALGAGTSAQWSLAGGTLLSSAIAPSVLFDPGAGPIVTLQCTVSNPAGSASSSRWMLALPFAPRNHLADLKASLAAASGAIASEVLSGDPSTYYSTSYVLHGLAAAAEASGDTAVMDTLVGYINQMIDRAQPLVRNGVTYQQWGPWDANGNPQQLNTFQSTVPLARTAAVIAGNPAFRTRYAASFNRIVAYVDQSIFKFWFDKQTGIYADPTSTRLGGIVPWLALARGGWGSYPVWSDKCSHFGAMSAWMYRATRNPLYLEYATRIAEDFKTHVTVVNGCWIWDFGTVPVAAGANQDGSPDTSHANREPMMAAAMYEAGITFKLADLQGMAATLTTRIWNQSTTSPMFANYISGGNERAGTKPPWSNGNIYLGWNMLGRYAPAAARVIALFDQALQVQTGGTGNPSLASANTMYGLIEMAGTQALNSSR